MRFNFDVKLTDEDYFTFNEFHAKHSSMGKKTTLFAKVVSSLIFLIGAAFILINGGINPPTVTAAVVLLAGAVGCFLSFNKLHSKIFRLQLKALMKKEKMPYTPDSVMEFYDDCFKEISPENKSETVYTALEKVSVLRNRYVYLFLDGMRGYIIPVDCFSGIDQQEEFIGFLKEKGCAVEYFDKI